MPVRPLFNTGQPAYRLTGQPEIDAFNLYGLNLNSPLQGSIKSGSFGPGLFT